MALTDDEQLRAARELGAEIYERAIKTANLGTDNLKAAVDAIDDSFDRTTLNVGRTIKQTILDDLPEPFASNSTSLEKATALTVWALLEINRI
jgi:hypothetical protein